jgi:hypothetical protein
MDRDNTICSVYSSARKRRINCNTSVVLPYHRAQKQLLIRSAGINRKSTTGQTVTALFPPASLRLKQLDPPTTQFRKFTTSYRNFTSIQSLGLKRMVSFNHIILKMVAYCLLYDVGSFGKLPFASGSAVLRASQVTIDHD